MENEKRLIDANELEAKFHETKMIEIFPYWKELNFDTQCELVRFGKALKKMMQNAPTVDAVEVAHGRWEKHEPDKCGNRKPKCSICGEYHLAWWSDYTWCNYCPNCGARMDGDSQ